MVSDNVTFTDVWANRYTTGLGWDNAIRLEIEDFGSARVPHIVLDEWGDGIALWEQYNGSARNIYARPYEFGQGWNATVLVSVDNVADYAAVPEIAIDGNGNAMAIWKQRKAVGVRTDLWACRFVKGVGWESSELIETENRGGPSDPSNLDIAMDAAGNAFAIWRHSDRLIDHIWVNRYTIPDIVPPILSITSPEHESTLDTPVVTVSGTTEPGVTLNINGILTSVGSDGTFSLEITLLEGNNTITVTATDSAGNPSVVSLTVTYDAPVIDLEDELNSMKNELNATSGDIADLQSQSLILMVILAVFAILAAVMAVMYMNLRKKIGELSQKPLKQEPPRPPTG